MEAFITYFILANFLLLLLVAYYRLFLAKQRRFHWNRIFLLGGLAAAVILPLLKLDLLPTTIQQPNLIPNLMPTMQEIVIGPSNQVVQTASTAWNWVEIAFGIYLLGIVLSLGALLFRNVFILNLIRKGKKTKHDTFTLVQTPQNIGPASYFKYIFWDAALDQNAENAAVALAHEQCHSRQLHSLDLLAVESLKALFWINPAIYLLRQNLRQTHEFLADEAALQVAGAAGIKRLMLNRHFGARQYHITNCFHSHIKARIKMLTENVQRKTILQYVFIAPLLILMAACSSLGNSPETLATGVKSDISTKVLSDSSQENEIQRVKNFNEPKAELYSVSDMLLRSSLPELTASDQKKGIVCLGEQPGLLNLDSLQVAVEGQPKMLNHDRISKLIGYPKAGETSEFKGKVVAKVLVDESGRVIRYQFIEEGPAIFRDAVAAHIEELLFTPGSKEGKPAKWWVIVPFRFGLGGC